MTVIYIVIVVKSELIATQRMGYDVYDVATLNNGFPIKTVITATIGSFRIPYVPSNMVYQPQYEFFRRVYLDLENIGTTQEVNTGIQQRNFIFEFEVINDGLGYILNPIQPTITFAPNLQQLTELRWRFKLPYQRYASFYQDVFNISAVIPAPGLPPADRRIQTTVPHGLTIGNTYAVWVTNYNSNNQLLNNTLNNTNGLLADVIDATTLQFTNVPNANLIATSYTASGDIPTGVLNVGANRVAFEITFRTLLPDYTNFIMPT